MKTIIVVLGLLTISPAWAQYRAQCEEWVAAHMYGSSRSVFSELVDQCIRSTSYEQKKKTERNYLNAKSNLDLAIEANELAKTKSPAVNAICDERALAAPDHLGGQVMMDCLRNDGK
jgi:hypothetical protein